MQLTGPAGTSEVQCFALDRDASKQLPAEIAKRARLSTDRMLELA